MPTGHTSTRYYPALGPVDSPMKKLPDKILNRYSISVRDFEKAKEFICAAKEHPPSSVEYEALLFAAIVSYYRPFSPNERGNSSKAESCLRLEEFDSLTREQKELHEKCKILRNKALAHSEFNHNPTKFNPETGAFASKPFSLLSQNFDLNLFDTVVTKFLDACHNKRAEHALHGHE